MARAAQNRSTHPGLQFDWEQVDGKTVTAALGQFSEFGGCEAAALVVGSRAIKLTIAIETDELIIRLVRAPTGGSWRPIEALAFGVGKTLGWCWEFRNYRGYWDGFAVAFGDVVPDALEPRVLIIAESFLSIQVIRPELVHRAVSGRRKPNPKKRTLARKVRKAR